MKHIALDVDASIKRREYRRRYRKRIRTLLRPHLQPGEKQCMICGNTFNAKPRQFLCSTKCKAERQKEVSGRGDGYTIVSKRCIVCLKTFEGKKNKLLCSKACYAERQRQMAVARFGLHKKSIPCGACGKAIVIAGRSHKKTCGKECQKRYAIDSAYKKYKMSRPKEMRHCKVCGVEFEPYGTQLTCGEACAEENKKTIRDQYGVRCGKKAATTRVTDDIACSVMYAASVLTQQLERIVNK